MKLFHAPTSPYVRKVMALAHEIGLADQLDLVFSGTTPLASDQALLSFNPLGKIPALLIDGGTCLFDSRVICEYLASLANDTKLFPVSGERRWAALSQQALGDGLLDAALLARYEVMMRPDAERSSNWRAAQLRKVEAALDSIEAILASIDDAVTIGSITFGCALGYLDFRFPELVWRDGRPVAAQWFAAFDARPSMAATRPLDRSVAAADNKFL